MNRAAQMQPNLETSAGADVSSLLEDFNKKSISSN
jgi:hypothetical protein